MNANQLVGLSCPNCGGGLGAPNGADYLCAYCGHRSRPRARLAAAEQQAALAAAMARFAERRASHSAARAQLRQREREAFLAKRSENAWVCFGIGVLFSLIGLAGTVIILLAGAIPIAWPLGWSAGVGLMFYIFHRYRRAGVREKKLRATGFQGRALVSSLKDTRVVVDGNPRVELVLRVELPNREPYNVKTADYVPNLSKLVCEGTDLHVFVNPSNSNDVLVDWWDD